MIKASDLTEKEVVNITDGKRIGMIADMEVDLQKGKINAIIIPDSGRLRGLFSKELEFEIRWNQIKKIGEDVILVEIKDGSEPLKASSSDEEVIYIPREVTTSSSETF
ncbi:YlmC/YmxH family sporulation protein [Alkaliphilus sp. MSJ-5]|uniref:YlmC/YmxH family sporulation protein n=1 Tax=Alkaliphilus flagellatus TaxID=2841507 RepID=A0ABS6G5A0_9FIRM|nr:YlmC/YmxH family sporulation protein [Alkaliphilus flagellatus]MBU5677306.1 YlmC/YmxH family sporulation protein [Alkaliphilus flagellatus]